MFDVISGIIFTSCDTLAGVNEANPQVFVCFLHTKRLDVLFCFLAGEESVALPTTDADAGTSTTAIPPVSSDVPVVPAAAPAVAARHVLLAGGITDEGVKGKVNQDDFFVWQSADKCSYIMGVFDGHGRELGHYAARVARESFAEKLGNEAAIAALRDNPAAVLHDAFEAAHAAVIKVRSPSAHSSASSPLCAHAVVLCFRVCRNSVLFMNRRAGSLACPLGAT